MGDGHENQPMSEHQGAAILEKVVIGGDLSRLTAQERMLYYTKLCESLDLNPLTKPFDYIPLNGKLTLYARRDATDQLRAKKGISVVSTKKEEKDGLYIVEVKASDAAGREDFATGIVTVEGLSGNDLANAMMKAETKAKRRATLSIVGLGMLDETELETIPKPQRTFAELYPQVKLPDSQLPAKEAEDYSQAELKPELPKPGDVNLFEWYKNQILTAPNRKGGLQFYSDAAKDPRINLDQRTVLGDTFNEKWTKK